MTLNVTQYHLILLTFTLLIGACIGSFLNVVVLRLPQKQSLLFPRSHCTSCKKTIPNLFLIPLFGFFLSQGRCHFCKNKISLQYPLVEFLAALGTYFIFRWFLPLMTFYGGQPTFYQWIGFLQGLFLFYTGIVLTFIDIKHRILPNSILLWGAILGIITGYLNPQMTFWQSLLGGMIPFFSLWIFCVLYQWVRKQEGMGFGDLKYLGMLGFFLGIKATFFTLFLASLLGAGTGICMGILSQFSKKKELQKKESFLQASLPFGPFLFLASFSLFLLLHSPYRLFFHV